jgi:streptogramin lyase
VAAVDVNAVDTIAIADAASHIVFTTTGADTPQPVAGTGAACASPTDACGDGATASRAELNAPHGVWYDPTGNLYIADTGDNRIRKADTVTGTITTVGGTGQSGYTGDKGPATTAQLAAPTDVVGDRLGNLYVADAGNAAIRRIDPAGEITTLAGGDGSLTNPTSVTVDDRNRLYLADAGANVIDTLNVFGFASPAAGTGTAGYGGDGGPALVAQLDGPLGITAVGDDALYVADTNNQRIRLIQPVS